MFGIILVPLCMFTVYAVARRLGASQRLIRVLLLAFALRMGFLFVVRDVQWFSHPAGGDSVGYEMLAGLVVEYWENRGFAYITVDQLPVIGPTTLPINLFALVMYLNGGPTRAGCTAIIAMMACFTCLLFLRLARYLGADEKIAERVMYLILFMPSFMLYTSDMFKDGLVIFCVIGAVGSSTRLARRFTMPDFILGVVCLAAVWGIRYYLLFACITPLLVGLAGFGGRSMVRPVMVSLGIVCMAMAVGAYTHIIEDARESAYTAFDFSYGWRAQLSSHRGGSGVSFDDHGDPTQALPQKLAYTLLAPFPWMSGSFGLNVGKIDTLIFYFFIYRALVAARRLVWTDKALLMTFLTFLVPLTVIYAMSVANVGLVLRQRMPIVVMTMLLATLSWPRAETEAAAEAEHEDDSLPAPGLARQGDPAGE